MPDREEGCPEKRLSFWPVGFGRRVRDGEGETAAICPKVCLHDLAKHKTALFWRPEMVLVTLSGSTLMCQVHLLPLSYWLG